MNASVACVGIAANIQSLCGVCSLHSNCPANASHVTDSCPAHTTHLRSFSREVTWAICYVFLVHSHVLAVACGALTVTVAKSLHLHLLLLLALVSVRPGSAHLSHPF